MKRLNDRWAITGCLLMAALATPATGSEWLRFRGPNGQGYASDLQPGPVTWSESENLKWKVNLPGPGSSSPIIVGDKILVTCWSGYGVDRESPGDQAQLKRHLLCIDRSTGRVQWDAKVDPYLPEDEYGGMFAEHGYASHTPVSDGDHVYAYFGKTGLVAFDLDGKQLWQRSVGTESGAMGWGSASSPVLFENLVIVTATAESEALVALDKATGEEVWRQEASGFSGVWGTPVLVPVNENRTDLVIAVPNEIWGFNPANGKLIWYCRAMSNNSFCSSVVADQGVIYAIESGPGGGGGIAVRAGGTGDVTDTHVLWSGRQQNRIGTPLVYEGRIYTFGGGVATCLDAKTGEQLFRLRLRGSRGGGGGGGRGQDYSSPVLAGGLIYFASRAGDVYVIQAGDSFLQLAVNRVTSEAEDFSGTPVICDGQLFLRSSKRLYCVENANSTPPDLANAVAAAKAAAANEPADEAEVGGDRPGPGGPGRGGPGRGGPGRGGPGRGGPGGGGGFDPAAFFRQQDTDGDGKLTGDEISGRLRDSLAQIDTDGDGAVTEEEYRAGMRQLFQRQGRGGFGGGRGGGQSNKPERPQRPPLGDEA